MIAPHSNSLNLIDGVPNGEIKLVASNKIFHNLDVEGFTRNVKLYLDRFRKTNINSIKPFYLKNISIGGK